MAFEPSPRQMPRPPRPPSRNPPGARAIDPDRAAPHSAAGSYTAALARLAPLARDLGVALPAGSAAGFERYLSKLLEWNQRINLTAVTDPGDVVRKHFADSLALVPHVATSASLVDVGTGAGFPGAVVALVRPDLRVTLVEPSHKRAAFLRVLVRELPLPQVEVRGETYEVAVGALGPRFDAAVSRATWDLPDWLERGRALVHPGGLVLGMEGAEVHPQLPDGATRHTVPLPDATRAIITLPVGA